MDSEEEVFESEEVAKEQSNEDSGSGMAGIACASTPALKFFDNNSCDVKAPTYCFMEKASKGKVPPKKQKAYASDGFSSSDDDQSKLIKIAKEQQYSLHKLEKTLRKAKNLLVEEMKKNQTLRNKHSTLLAKFEDLSGCHDFLSDDHERLNYDFLKRKQELKSLRASHDDLQKDNDSLLAQQISAAQEEFVAP